MANTNAGMGELARAQKTRGKVAATKIADDVINRIVANTSHDFQDFLARQGGGDASAAVTQALASAPAAPALAMPQFAPPPALNPYAQAAPDPRGDILRQLGVI